MLNNEICTGTEEALKLWLSLSLLLLEVVVVLLLILLPITIYISQSINMFSWGHAVVEASCYELDSRWFDSQ
jgi:hypothetical protein